MRRFLKSLSAYKWYYVWPCLAGMQIALLILARTWWGTLFWALIVFADVQNYRLGKRRWGMRRERAWVYFRMVLDNLENVPGDRCLVECDGFSCEIVKVNGRWRESS